MGRAAGAPLAFSALFESAASRVELVVTFLALLELVRLKQLQVRQSSAFEEILIYGKEDAGVPVAPVAAA